MKKNVFRFLGIVAVVAVIGFSFASCGGSGGKADPDLNGTWNYYSSVLILNNGNFEYSTSGTPLAKGKYTTSDGGNVTMTVTHLHGSSFSYMGNFDAKWYSKSEAKTKAKQLNPGVSDADIEDALNNEYFISQSGTYEINGSTLILSGFSYGGMYTKTKS